MAITFWKSKPGRKAADQKRDGRPEETANGVKSFRDQQQKEAAFDHRDRGIRSVPLGRIVGSVGRYKDFDGQFRFRPALPSDRLAGIKQAMRQGRNLGPVKLYQIKNEFYVLDGNHRIAAAHVLLGQFISTRFHYEFSHVRPVVRRQGRLYRLPVRSG